MKLFVVKFRRILEVLCLQLLRESAWRILTIYVSKNEAFCCEVQTHLGSFHIVKFIKDVLGKFSWFMCMKTMVFAMKFRRSLEVFRLQD